MTDLYEKGPGWDSPPAGRCRPGMVELRDFLVEQMAGTNLGCYGDRAKTGGASPSLHRDGRAIDIGFAGKLVEREAAYEFLIANAAALRIQMVLNYSSGEFGGTRWRLPYYHGDPKAGRGIWSKSGHWLHIERTNAGADDGRPVAELVGGVTPPPPPPPPAPAPTPPPSNTPRMENVNVSMPTIKSSSSTKNATTQLQTLLRLKSDAGLKVDGSFGKNTTKAVKNWQGFFGLTVDGIVGPQTWASVLTIY